jgi:2-C-methyl-D-erythritol 4-phosphate cytidylyltransferase
MTTVILLAGGIGSRMGSPLPKQFLLLNKKPIALHSFELFANHPLVKEIVVVCEPEYQHFFSGPVKFAIPGPRRQDSVYSGLLKSTQEIVLTHDSARPFLESKYLSPLLEAVRRSGAAALGAPVTSTIKQCLPNKLVEKTLDRSALWEIQTPQGMHRDLFFQTFEYVQKYNLDVTDELSMVEAIGHPSEIVPCTPRNFKITTPFDLAVAETLCATS